MKHSNLTLNIYGPTPHGWTAFEKPAPRDITVASMLTAIFMIYTSEGFAIVSDSKGSMNKGTGEQKIFDASGPDWCLACGVSGTASAVDKQSGRDIFKELYACVIGQLKTLTPRNLTEYADLFISLVEGSWRSEVYSQYDWPKYSLKVQLAGYFKGQPGIAEREIFFDRYENDPPKKSSTFCPTPSEYSLEGSQPVKAKILSGDPDFQKFKTDGLTKIAAKDPSISLQEAMHAATQYIEACKSPKARELDSYCKSIDGRICTAVLTPTNTFQWGKNPPISSFNCFSVFFFFDGLYFNTAILMERRSGQSKGISRSEEHTSELQSAMYL